MKLDRLEKGRGGDLSTKGKRLTVTLQVISVCLSLDACNDIVLRLILPLRSVVCNASRHHFMLPRPLFSTTLDLSREFAAIEHPTQIFI
jgi:hypothetical protein